MAKAVNQVRQLENQTNKLQLEVSYWKKQGMLYQRWVVRVVFAFIVGIVSGLVFTVTGIPWQQATGLATVPLLSILIGFIVVAVINNRL